MSLNLQHSVYSFPFTSNKDLTHLVKEEGISFKMFNCNTVKTVLNAYSELICIKNAHFKRCKSAFNFITFQG